MANFYITKPVYNRQRQTDDERNEEEWFFKEEEYTRGFTFSDDLPSSKIILRRWCQTNLQGDVAIVLGVDRGTGRYSYTIWFELETDAAGFKLKWM